MQIDTCVYPQCVASIVLTACVYIQKLPGMCLSLHVMHAHDNGEFTHIEPTNR